MKEIRNPNPNHPKKGQTITVEPIKKEKDIRSIKSLLSDNPRDLLLFTIGINNGLRIGDLLKLKVKDVRHLKSGDSSTIIENKTGKKNILMVNKTVSKVLKNYLDKTKSDDDGDDFLFKSRKGEESLNVSSVNALLKKWTRSINLKGNYGAHTLRKTFGFQQRTKYSVGFEVLAKRYNHTNPAITMRYLGINDKEVNGILMNEI